MNRGTMAHDFHFGGIDPALVRSLGNDNNFFFRL